MASSKGKHSPGSHARPAGRSVKQNSASREDFEYQLRRLYVQKPEVAEDPASDTGAVVKRAQPAANTPVRQSGGRRPAGVPQKSGARPASSGAGRPVQTAPAGKGGARSFFRVVGRILAVLLVTALLFAVFVVGVVGVITHGPSVKARNILVGSLSETSALYFVPNLFLSDETVDAILHPEVKTAVPDTFREIPFETASGEEIQSSQPELVHIDTENPSEELTLVDVKGATFKGKMLIIRDPSRVVVGTLDHFGGYGIYLSEFIEKYGAVAGTNAGGFYDPDGQGNGGIPDGLVMRDGRIAFGDAGTFYKNVIGFDNNNRLIVGDMTGQQALEAGYQSAVSFSPGPVLIRDGERQGGWNASLNPRTCIGQCADGTVLLAVIEGRHIDSMGASFDDLADLMASYGAVNAANLDGGSSSAMIYNGEQITKGSNLIGSRQMCTAILVLP